MPILKKSSYVASKIDFTKKDYQNLLDSDKFACLLAIKDDDNLLVTVELNNEENKIINLNSDFDETTSLKCYLEIDNNIISYPFVCLECAAKI